MPKEHSDELVKEIERQIVDWNSPTNFDADVRTISERIAAWHTRQLQDFANKVESEIIGGDIPMLAKNMTGFVDEVGYNEDMRKLNRLKATQRQALNKLLKDIER